MRLECDVDQGGGHILDKYKVAGLLPIPMDGDGSAGEGGLEKSWDSSSVGAVRILMGPIHIKKA